MVVSLPTFRKEGTRFVCVADSRAASRAATLLDKHSPTITRLRKKLGFQKDETVIAWLLEQMEMAPDLGNAIYKLLEDKA
jgi:hypothetical protein